MEQYCIHSSWRLYMFAKFINTFKVKNVQQDNNVQLEPSQLNKRNINNWKQYLVQKFFLYLPSVCLFADTPQSHIKYLSKYLSKYLCTYLSINYQSNSLVLSKNQIASFFGNRAFLGCKWCKPKRYEPKWCKPALDSTSKPFHISCFT